MKLLENIGTYLISISGICAVVIILICIKNIMNLDEGEHRIYLKRIKNTIVAFICIISVIQIRNLTFKYFKNDDLGIGTIDSSITGQTGSLFSVKTEDVQGRKVIENYEYEGSKYTLVCTASEPTIISCPSLSSKGLKTIYGWKLFSDCQGLTKGTLAKMYFYSFSNDGNKPLYYCGDKNIYTLQAGDQFGITFNADLTQKILKDYNIQ